jgi:hypothetical protein
MERAGIDARRRGRLVRHNVRRLANIAAPGRSVSVSMRDDDQHRQRNHQRHNAERAGTGPGHL